MDQALLPADHLPHYDAAAMASTDPAEKNEKCQSANRRLLNGLLVAGILLRLAVLLTASPFNADNHFQVIQYIAATHRLPISNQLPQSYHPPLYYLLMAPIYSWWSDAAPIHLFSFIFSTATLLIIWKVARRKDVLADPAAKLIAFAFASFLPELVMFGSFISNDTLTILIGAMLFAAAVGYVCKPTFARLATLGIVMGLGLLTKGTFLLTPLAITIVIAVIEFRRRSSAFARIAAFCAIWAILGCYKYVENAVNFGNPIVHNLDDAGPVMQSQRGVWKGPQTIFDLNIVKLIRRPILQIHNTFSYPLLFYATFWYPHIPDSSYRANINGYAWVGSLIYALAIVPTLIFLIGLARGTWISATSGLHSPRDRLVACAIAMLLANFLVVLAAGIKYDIWSCFQSRLCFQSFLPMMMLFSLGMEILPRWRWLRGIVQTICWGTVLCCLLYFAVEIALVRGLLKPGTPVKP
jgi:hypothetical protein